MEELCIWQMCDSGHLEKSDTTWIQFKRIIKQFTYMVFCIDEGGIDMKSHVRKALACSGIIILFMAGCQQNPDMEYVANKEGQNTFILDNITEDAGIPIAQQINAPGRITASCEKVNEYTSIEIDAAVVTPDCTSIPVYTVSSLNMDGKTVEEYTKILYESGEFYNREYGPNNSMYQRKIQTADELYAIIEGYEQILNTAEITETETPVMDEYGTILEISEDDRAVFERVMNGYRERLPEAEDRSTYGAPVSYDFVNRTEEVYWGAIDGNPLEFDYEYQTATFTGLHNGTEYDLSLYRDGMNSEIRFMLPKNIRMNNGYSQEEIVIQYGEDSGSYMTKPNTCQYSQEEAVNLCKDFMAELGIGQMECSMVENIALIKNYTMPNEMFLGNKGYRIYFFNGFGDMTDCYSPSFDANMVKMWETNCPYGSIMQKSICSLEGKRTSREMLDEEFSIMENLNGMAVFQVMDDGIVDAWILNPLMNPELLAENVRLMSFDQIMQRGIAQLEILYGDSGGNDILQGERQRNVEIRITAICLHYARMQSPDTEGEYAMIPVWDFKTGGINGESILTINAIDGTVFDRETGY